MILRADGPHTHSVWLHGLMGDRRLFTAVRPPPAQLAELEAFLETAGFAAANLKMVRPENWHITLSFMPAVTADQIEALHDALVWLSSSTVPMDLVLRRAGTFARSGMATPMWIGVEGDLDELGRLAAGCRAAAHRSGTRLESPKHYRPHLTLARRRPTEHAALWMERLDRFDGTPWMVEEVTLVESILGVRGESARHGIIGRYALTG